MINGLNGRKFPFFNLVHQLPWTTILVCNFLNFIVEKGSLDVFNYLFEFLPMFETPWCSVIIERVTVFFCPPLFGMLGDFWFLGIFCPSLVDNHSNFSMSSMLDVSMILKFEMMSSMNADSWSLFGARDSFDVWMNLFEDRDIDGERSMIWK